MQTSVFINLHVRNLDASVSFFTGLGFSFNPDFTDENATCMVVSDTIYVMLLVEKYFQSFTGREIPDLQKTSEVIIALGMESREKVDTLVRKALESGGSPLSDAKDYGWMFQWGFRDPDGHIWELSYMDPAGPPAA